MPKCRQRWARDVLCVEGCPADGFCGKAQRYGLKVKLWRASWRFTRYRSVLMDPFAYVYAMGGLVFLVGLIYAWRHGYVSLSGAGLRNLLICASVGLFFLILQAWLQYSPMTTAPAEPYQGGADHLLKTEGRTRGTPLDYGIVIGYFLLILVVGTFFARRQKTTRDFFFGGQRFSWWLISFSMIATTVGSYSFVKYSTMGYSYGLSSSQTYLNDWLWFPLLIFGWLPLIYFSRVTSVPEYFGRRFNSTVRFWATVYLLIYLIGYVGVNLFTMGKVLNILLGWPIPLAALIVAAVSASYVTAGGQTSVIMTDLIQGAVLLLVGGLLLFLGIQYLGGMESFWTHLPRESRLAFPNFNEDPEFPSAGIFWQDGFANTAMFYFLNQGIIMRYLAAKSVADSRKAVTVTMLVLMTVAACVVACGGWIARAMVHAGALPSDVKPDQAFFVAAEFLSRPGFFGLILAALTAALMSTVDTLITAVSAISVNDLYRVYWRPKAPDKELLRVARWSALGVTVLGLLLVPVFMNFKSIYAAHGAFTAAVTPPLAVTLLFSVFWRRFTRTAALWTLIGGMAAIVLSLFVPEVITPLAHGVPAGPSGEGFLGGMHQHKFMRACYGTVVSALLGIVVTWLTRPEPVEKQRGLVWGTIADALRNYKGSPGSERPVKKASAMPQAGADDTTMIGDAHLPSVGISKQLAKELEAAVGDLVYVTDRRRWTGGLFSTQAVVGTIDHDQEGSIVTLPPKAFADVTSPRRANQPVRVERLY